MKYVNAPNFEKFREDWNAKYLGALLFTIKHLMG